MLFSVTLSVSGRCLYRSTLLLALLLLLSSLSDLVLDPVVTYWLLSVVLILQKATDSSR